MVGPPDPGVVWTGRANLHRLEEAEAKAKARAAYGKDEPLTRNSDVLDTWFSSGAVAILDARLAGADQGARSLLPDQLLVTGFDIIFFWVARMMMSGMHFMGEVPFRDVYIHGLVLDEKGQKMSKTKGNVIDPLELIDLYGADALRFTLTAMTAQGRNVRLSKQRVEGYRNFATKLWNAVRFAEINQCRRIAGFEPASAKETLNRWIAGETERTAATVTAALEAYRFNDAATAIYEFVWGTFCDWYLELAKPVLMAGIAPGDAATSTSETPAQAETRAMVAWTLDQILGLLHPFMPFLTEELWQRTGTNGPARQSLLTLAQWPQPKIFAQGGGDGDAVLDQAGNPVTDQKEEQVYSAADSEIGWLVKLISEIRSVRSEMNVPAGARIPLVLVGASEETTARAARHADTIMRLARIGDISHAASPPKQAAQIVLAEMTACLPLAGVIDMAAERKRIEKSIAGANSDMGKMDAKLNNPNFISRAVPEAIEEARERKAELTLQLAKLDAALARLAE